MASDEKKPQPTHYDVLALTTQGLASQDEATQARTVKQAYRRALLTHHPDKKAQQTGGGTAPAAAAAAAEHSPSQQQQQQQQQQHFTVDQITEAYNVLSDATQRDKYTAKLQRQRQRSSSATGEKSKPRGRRSKAGGAPAAAVAVIDLDDMAWSGRRRLYHYPCAGCGKPRGFGLLEDELDDEEEEEEAGGEFEMVLECSGCGLELRVVVPPVGEGEEDAEEEEKGAAPGVGARRGGDLAGEMWNQWSGVFDMGNGGGSGVDAAPVPPPPPPEKEKKKGGWGLKLGLGLGISLGGGASAGRAR